MTMLVLFYSMKEVIYLSRGVSRFCFLSSKGSYFVQSLTNGAVYRSRGKLNSSEIDIHSGNQTLINQHTIRKQHIMRPLKLFNLKLQLCDLTLAVYEVNNLKSLISYQ